MVQDLEVTLQRILHDILSQSSLQKGDIFVLGCSTSEVVGGHIGKQSNAEIGERIVATVLEVLRPLGIYLAVQGCEHLNRALVVERRVAQTKSLEVVNVVPSLHAGGACSVAAFKLYEQPVEVEFIKAQAGIDIGDTAIGMHIQHVQVPVRPSVRMLGQAHVTALNSRPKYIGGPRAIYI